MSGGVRNRTTLVRSAGSVVFCKPTPIKKEKNEGATRAKGRTFQPERNDSAGQGIQSISGVTAKQNAATRKRLGRGSTILAGESNFLDTAQDSGQRTTLG